jgi:hypothetical protein
MGLLEKTVLHIFVLLLYRATFTILVSREERLYKLSLVPRGRQLRKATGERLSFSLHQWGLCAFGRSKLVNRCEPTSERLKLMLVILWLASVGVGRRNVPSGTVVVGAKWGPRRKDNREGEGIRRMTIEEMWVLF